MAKEFLVVLIKLEIVKLEMGKQNDKQNLKSIIMKVNKFHVFANIAEMISISAHP